MTSALSRRPHSNPVLPGFHPDPSIVRVGEWYYVVNSSFEYLPGIPVHRSRDLVEWELVGHVATRPGQLGVAQAPANGGVYAPTIRHHDGLFHVVVTDAWGRGTLHFTAVDPAGPWSDGAVLCEVDGKTPLRGIDPDIAWDAEGVCYVTYCGLDAVVEGAIAEAVHPGIQQVRVDLASHRALEPPRGLWSGTGLKFPEAPHLYEIGGRWYLVIAEGGTERGHALSIARGPSPAGPFEGAPHNPILSARSTARSVQATAHGDLVQGVDGTWWCVVLGTRPGGRMQSFSPLGRETFVTSVTWSDGWPVIAPVEAVPEVSDPCSVSFADPWGPEWVGVRRFPHEFADQSTRPGWLTLHGDGSGLDDPRPVFLARRQQALDQQFTASVDTTAGSGGLAARFDERFYVSIEAGGGKVTARAAVAGLTQEWSAPCTPLVDLHLSSRTEVSGASDETCDTIMLAATMADGRRVELASVDGRVLSLEVVESFTGRMVGLFATEGSLAVREWRAESTASAADRD